MELVWQEKWQIHSMLYQKGPNQKSSKSIRWAECSQRTLPTWLDQSGCCEFYFNPGKMLLLEDRGIWQFIAVTILDSYICHLSKKVSVRFLTLERSIHYIVELVNEKWKSLMKIVARPVSISFRTITSHSSAMWPKTVPVYNVSLKWYYHQLCRGSNLIWTYFWALQSNN